jgi:hypothetical protein
LRDFAEIQRELSLTSFVESANGDLYYAPVVPGKDRLIIRLFNRDLPPELIPVYLDLHAAAQAWLERDPELAMLVRVAQPIEVGRDFVARVHFFGTSLARFLSPASDEEPEELPPDLVEMQKRFAALAKTTDSPCGKVLAAVLRRSLAEVTCKTVFDSHESRFVVAELKPTRAEVERWAELNST